MWSKIKPRLKVKLERGHHKGLNTWRPMKGAPGSWGGEKTREVGV